MKVPSKAFLNGVNGECALPWPSVLKGKQTVAIYINKKLKGNE